MSINSSCLSWHPWPLGVRLCPARGGTSRTKGISALTAQQGHRLRGESSACCWERLACLPSSKPACSCLLFQHPGAGCPIPGAAVPLSEQLTGWFSYRTLSTAPIHGPPEPGPGPPPCPSLATASACKRRCTCVRLHRPSRATPRRPTRPRAQRRCEPPAHGLDPNIRDCSESLCNGGRPSTA